MKNKFRMVERFLMVALLLSASVTSVAGSVIVNQSESERVQRYADVDEVQYITGQDESLKIFSVSGGDPAMNGAYLKLAVFRSPADGWDVFELANVRSYKLLQSSKKGFLKISLATDTFDSNGEIIQKKSILYLNITKINSGTIEAEEISQK